MIDSAAVAIAFGLAGLAIALRTTLRQRRQLADLRSALGADDVAVARLERRARRLVEEAAEARGLAERIGRDLETLVERMGLAAIHVDESLVIQFATPQAGTLAGRPGEDLVGRTLGEAFVDPRVGDTVRVAIRQGPVVETIASHAGDGLAFLLRTAPSSHGGAWLLLEDVAELRRLRRIRTEFVDNLSHELRTPVTTIGLLAEALSRDASRASAAIPAPFRERIAKIEVETGHLAQMVSELLDLARIESGETRTVSEPVDLGAIAREAVERIGPFAEEARVELVTWAEPGLPLALGDGPRLSRVVVNLVHNAVKFSPAGGTVSVAVERDGERIALRVRDQGIGIAPADLPRIFERFYKVDRARARGGGTGLGLAIARHIVEGHGGTIGVESRLADGSTFTVHLPSSARASIAPLRSGSDPNVADGIVESRGR